MSDQDGFLFTLNASSIAAYNNSKVSLEMLINMYLFEYKTPKLLDELKQRAQYILDSNIISQRMEKINRINYNYSHTRKNIIEFDFKIEIEKSNN